MTGLNVDGPYKTETDYRYVFVVSRYTFLTVHSERKFNTIFCFVVHSVSNF